MSYLLVPHGVSDRSADVWFATIDEAPIRSALSYGAGVRDLGPADWHDWQFGGHAIRHGLVTLSGLDASTAYAIQLRAGDAVVARCAVTTLPTRLPGVAERPFTVLLGSCFCRRQDDAGDVGRTFFHLPTGAAPD